MTFRSILLGLLGAVFVCVYTYFNDAVMHQTMFVGNTMPISVYGGLLIVVLLVNPLLRRVGAARWQFTGRELAVVLVITLGACCIPGSGLMRTFTSTLIMPHHYARTDPGWRERGVVEMLPQRMLVDTSADEDTVLNGFVQGLGETGKHITPGTVPWAAWARSLCFWVPVILTLWLGLLGLSLVLHRQWADHERLPYPIAAFADSILPDENGGAAEVFRSRLFWGGALAVMALHLNNYLASLLPDILIPVRLSVNLWPLTTVCESISRGGGWFFFEPRLYFTPFAFAYFLASDVALSLGIAPVVFAFVSGRLAHYGISLGGGGFYAPTPARFLGCGAFLATFGALLYTGRQHLLSVARRALGLKAGDEVAPDAVWGARLVVACFLFFVVQLAVVGLDWQLAVLYTLGLVVIFTVMSRVMAESGLFFVQAWWFPCGILTGLLGNAAMGPQAMLIMMVLTTVLALDTREAFMPYMANSLRLAELRGVPRGRTATWCGVALVAGLAVAIPWVLYLQYDMGVDMADTWGNVAVPKFAFDQTSAVTRVLDAQGALGAAQNVSGWHRFTGAAPAANLLTALGAGIALVALFSFLRLRFPWWPLHPVLFIVWQTYPAMCFWASFFLGWMVKGLVTKYGGAGLYARLKPLMIGLIAGETLAGLVPVLVGLIQYLVTGHPPARFSILPG